MADHLWLTARDSHQWPAHPQRGRVCPGARGRQGLEPPPRRAAQCRAARVRGYLPGPLIDMAGAASTSSPSRSESASVARTSSGRWAPCRGRSRRSCARPTPPGHGGRAIRVPLLADRERRRHMDLDEARRPSCGGVADRVAGRSPRRDEADDHESPWLARSSAISPARRRSRRGPRPKPGPRDPARSTSPSSEVAEMPSRRRASSR